MIKRGRRAFCMERGRTWPGAWWRLQPITLRLRSSLIESSRSCLPSQTTWLSIKGIKWRSVYFCFLYFLPLIKHPVLETFEFCDIITTACRSQNQKVDREWADGGVSQCIERLRGAACLPGAALHWKPRFQPGSFSACRQRNHFWQVTCFYKHDNVSFTLRFQLILSFYSDAHDTSLSHTSVVESR